MKGKRATVRALRKKRSANVSIEIPVLCRFWQEDDVWNGTADDLPVAVFGRTFEQARSNMTDAILAHLESLRDLHLLDETIKSLRQKNHERPLPVHELPLNQMFTRISATLQDRRIAALI